MKKQVLVSIIIPVYKVENWIEGCLLSVCNQTYENIECIIVNDATPDKSMDIVESILKNYTGSIRFKIITHELNRGLSAARNSGVKAATGDYLFFLDSDDKLYSADVVSIFEVYLQKYGNVDFLVGGFDLIGNTTSFKVPTLQEKVYNSKEDILISYLDCQWYVMACGKMISRSFFIEKNMWFGEGLLHEDELFSFRLAVFASTMVIISEKVYSYYINECSITGNKKYRNYLDYLSVILQNYNLIKENKIILNNRRVVNNYFISVLYGFVYHVVKNKKLNAQEQKKLIIKCKVLAKKMDLDIPRGIKSYIEYVLLNSPYYMLTIFLKIHVSIG
ncbi:glycosyltransferase family 2 protein [Bacteroides sp. AM16-24]|jgi:glycosyltransferase involved in cell wall biosynthesis|uniref:glycosyltransferase family 2 protein n=1 Tax=Bacteroides sp. AM16-24 TaxID=2292002 RepID=UPI000E48716B|nr:glycosyltransferase family 2 protein [Bacteroides sp. AM16-24]RHI11460.1 glycosyltransferase family 2 protein [Bacteroides sp. AM16-24]